MHQLSTRQYHASQSSSRRKDNKNLPNLQMFFSIFHWQVLIFPELPSWSNAAAIKRTYRGYFSQLS
jgi:hypothetical protein